jgi:Mg2+/Co2+ transporter CorB
VDEYGDIQGLITIEDVIREVIGEINQVTENDDLEIKKENATTYLIDAGISIKKLNRLLLWSLPNEGQSTINGLILEKLGEIPSLGSVIKINVYSFEIIDKNDQMIKSVRVTVEDQNS